MAARFRRSAVRSVLVGVVMLLSGDVQLLVVIVGWCTGGRRAASRMDDDLVAVFSPPDDARAGLARRHARQRDVVAFVDGDVAGALLVNNVGRHLNLNASQLFLHGRRVDLYTIHESHRNEIFSFFFCVEVNRFEFDRSSTGAAHDRCDDLSVLET